MWDVKSDGSAHLRGSSWSLGVEMGEPESAAHGRVTVYSIQGCPHCVQAKATLGGLGVPVRDVDLGKHPELRAVVKQLSGRSTVPQIFFNQVHVGGNDDLQKLPTDGPPLPDDDDDQSGDGTWEADDGELKCERDELASLVEDFKRSNVIGSHRVGLSLIRKSFSERQLIDWLQTEKGMGGQFGEGGGGDTLYRLLEHRSPLALNAGQTAACNPLQAAELSAIMREIVLKLFSDYLSADGKRVELLSLSREERLAFFINTYNALFFNYVSYLIGGEVFTLQDIENGFFNYVSYLIGGEVFTLQDIENGDIDGQLRTAAEAFLENDDGCVVDPGRRESFNYSLV
ncbi:hypothetical protein CRUP_004068 [Coryphaenoides rupestris]|nr:hypothetical protein CRUP_004068 [Coryphaenoides rupestris]